MSYAILFLLTLIPGATMTNRDACDPPAPADATAAVRALNERYIDAALRHDAEWFDEHMADEVIVILGDGRRLRKADFVGAVGSDTRAFRSLGLRDVTIRVFGPTVQVDADAPWELEDGRSGVSRYIDTWAWLDCRWQVVSAQITSLPAADEP